ncbi:ABC transporter permease [Terrarubrum flagellatum]|uniref:ABC transporter permease n=1 Tax=Terrirubrum flagellatum TaxID=2895980 RepID=UPI003144FBBB
MFSFLARRLASTIPVLLVVGVFIFLLLRLSPGDPATVLAGDQATPEQIEAVRRNLGLDQSLLIQFFGWLKRVLAGDLGQSLFSNIAVMDLVLQRLGPTIALALATIALAVLIGVPLGVLAAWKVGRWPDQLVMAIASAGFSIPLFIFAFGLIWLFGLKLRWLPVQGYSPPSAGVGPFLASLVLPAVALSVVYLALIARITRATIVELLNDDFIRTAEAKGASHSRIMIKHALRNAAVPILTVVGVSFSMLLGGVVVTENIFNIPGVGRLVADAILKRDYPIVQGVVLLFAGFYVVLNLVIDLCYAALDPRVRL